uniref:FERM domain-containing protein n=1 Tax=Macrostomum lignano TaxID=282301 RepID=A0A1I8HQF5_9PLAT
EEPQLQASGSSEPAVQAAQATENDTEEVQPRHPQPQQPPPQQQQQQVLPHSDSRVGEADTISKRDYYTLRDQGATMQPTLQRQSEGGGGGIRRLGSVKMRECLVVMLDGSVNSFEVDPASKAQDLFDETCKFLCLREKEYFGLCYRDSTHIFHWLYNDRRLNKQIGKNEWKLEFMVKFYPPDPENLRDNLTRYYMALQIRQNLMADILPCSFTTYIVLGSYVVQSEIGDYDPSDPRFNDVTYLQDCPFCREEFRGTARPPRSGTPRSWQCTALTCTKLRDSRGDEIYVGVYHGGVLVYRNSLRINHHRVVLQAQLAEDRPATGRFRLARLKRVVEFRCASSKLAKRLWRAVSPEKPAKPLIPRKHSKRNWNYTGPTRGQMNDQTLGPLPEALITPGMRKSFRKKARSWAAPVSTARQRGGHGLPLLPGAEAHLRTISTSSNQHSTLPAREQFDRRIELESVRQAAPVVLTPLDADVDGAGASVAIADQTVDGDETRRPPLLTAACPGGDWLGVRADSGVRNGGQWYFEVVVDVPDGANRDAD